MRRSGAAALLIAVAIVATACGSDGPSARQTPPPSTSGSPTDTPLTSPTPDGGAGRTVDVIDNAYIPPDLTVTSGTEVIWTQSGTSTHTVTASDNSFDSHPNCPNDPSACMKQGETFRHTFTAPGTYAYVCKVHGELMSGTIVVQ